jgi:hypothetical protein
MIFQFPKKKIVLDCFTYNENILKTAPIVLAPKLIPDWWKKLPTSTYKNSFFPMGTMRNCSGMVEYYKKSVAIPLWSDLAMNVNSEQGFIWQFSDRATEAHIHDISTEATGFLNNWGHFKIISPWFLSCKEDINWVWSHPTYSFPENNDVITPPAIVNFKHQHATNLNMLINLSKQKTITLLQGQPMIHLTPMSDRKVEVVRHLISIEEYNRKYSSMDMISFYNKYKTVTKRNKQFSDCPYHKETS